MKKVIEFLLDPFDDGEPMALKEVLGSVGAAFLILAFTFFAVL